MVKVKYISSAQRFGEEIVSGSTTVRSYLESKGALMTAQFSINGNIIQGAQLDMTLEEAKVFAGPDGLITLYETAKTQGACR